MINVESNQDDFNIYCTAADSSEHSLVQVPQPDLLRQIKLCSLLGKHVYVSCSHIYENPHTRALLQTYPDLLTTGIVAVGLRSDCRDFADLSVLRKSENRKVNPEDAGLSNFLNAQTATVIRWTPMDLQPQFKQCILDTVQNPDSLLRRRLTATPKARIKEFCQKLHDTSDKDATRTLMHALALKYLPNRTKAFMREINLLYYVMGSADKNLRPHLSPSLFTDLNAGCKVSIQAGRAAPLDKWLEETLREALFPVQLLDRLTIQQLASFRDENAVILQRFRSKWWRMAQSESETPAQDSLRLEVTSRLLDEVKRESRKLQAYEATSKFVSVASLIFACASLLPNPTLAAIDFLVSLAAYAASLEQVKHGVLKTNFSALTTALAKSVARA